MNTALLLLVLLLVAVIVVLLRRPRAGRNPMPPSPYARDDAFGRPPEPRWGAAPVDPYGYQRPPQDGMGSAIARGVATGLAVGAGAAIAQELGHRMFEHGHEGQAHALDPALPHVDQSHSQLARDAGIGAFDDPSLDAPQGLQGAGWDDPGGGFDDGGNWDT